MLVYILIACSFGSVHGWGSGCISVELPDLKQCQNVSSTFQKKVMEQDLNVKFAYCQEVRK